MDIFFNYFVPALCIAMFSMLPIYFIRMIFFIRKRHFIQETFTLHLSLYMHIFIYAMFIIHLFFMTKYISELVFYIFGIAMLAFLGLLLGYRKRFMYIKRNKFVVIYSKFNNRNNFQQFLDDRHYGEIDIMDGSFSYVTKIKFNNCSRDLIKSRFEEIEESGLLYSYKSLKGYLLFAANTALMFGSIIAFVIFFAYLPRLGY